MIQVSSKYRASSEAHALETPPGCLSIDVFEDDDPSFVHVVTRWPDLAPFQAWQAARLEQPDHEQVLRRRERVPSTNEVAAQHGLAQLTNELAVSLRETTRQKRMHWHIKKLQEVLPICMGCGFVHAEERGWQEAIQFLRERAPFLSHGYCPDCAARKRAEIDRELEDL